MNDYFFSVFENIPRQGPGLNGSTRKAFELIRSELPPNPEILDVGCGKGVQTLELARLSGAHITAVDNHQSFLDFLAGTATEQVPGQIDCLNADMASLPFRDGSFDLIWSEGSIFIIGMKEGLRSWKRFLKEDGFLVFSDLVWLTGSRPKEISGYLEGECLYVLTREEALEEAAKTGYAVVDHFTLPPEGWTREYHMPQREIIRDLRSQYGNNPEAEEVFTAMELEHTMFQKYHEYFGYEFFILRKGK